MEANRNNNAVDNRVINRSDDRRSGIFGSGRGGVIVIIRKLMAVVAMLALGLLASCGGAGSAMDELDAPADDAKLAGTAVDNAAPAEADSERSASSGWYVATSDAAYIDGIDYLFKLMTDGNGHYEFILNVTNNSSQPRHVSYNSTKRADFSIVKNGNELYRWSEGRLFGMEYITRTLNPYQSFEYSVSWNGRDRNGHAISGNVMAKAFHCSVSNPANLGQVAYLNGQVSN